MRQHRGNLCLISLKTLIFCNQLRTRYVHLNIIHLKKKSLITWYLRDQKCLTLDPYILQTSSLLKSIIDEKLLKIIFSIICTFHFVFKCTIMSFRRRSLKYTFSIYIQNKNWISKNLLKKKCLKSKDNAFDIKQMGLVSYSELKKGFKIF